MFALAVPRVKNTTWIFVDTWIQAVYLYSFFGHNPTLVQIHPQQHRQRQHVWKEEATYSWQLDACAMNVAGWAAREPYIAARHAEESSV